MAAPSIKNFKPQPKLPVNNFQKIVDGITQNSSLAVGMAAAQPLLPTRWWMELCYDSIWLRGAAT
jgi:hypothetical protein